MRRDDSNEKGMVNERPLEEVQEDWQVLVHLLRQGDSTMCVLVLTSLCFTNLTCQKLQPFGTAWRKQRHEQGVHLKELDCKCPLCDATVRRYYNGTFYILESNMVFNYRLILLIVDIICLGMTCLGILRVSTRTTT